MIWEASATLRHFAEAFVQLSWKTHSTLLFAPCLLVFFLLLGDVPQLVRPRVSKGTMKTPETDYQRDISGSAKSISSTSRGHCARPHCEDNDCGAERERGHRVSKNAVKRTPEIEHRPKEASSEHHVKSITLERSARQSPEIDECDTKRNALARCESGVSKSAIKIPERGLSSRGTPSEQHADGIDSEDCTLRLPQTGERETTKRTLANRGRGRSVISASFPLPPPGMCSPGPAASSVCINEYGEAQSPVAPNASGQDQGALQRGRVASVMSSRFPLPPPGLTISPAPSPYGVDPVDDDESVDHSFDATVEDISSTWPLQKVKRRRKVNSWRTIKSILRKSARSLRRVSSKSSSPWKR